LASRGTSHSPARILHLSGFTVVTADAAAQPKLNGQSAEEVARSFAAGRLPETVGPVTRLNGREVAASDLELVERFFAPATTEVSSDSYGYKFTNTVPENLWVLVYRASNVELLDSRAKGGQVRVVVLVNDETSSVVGASISAIHPSALRGGSGPPTILDNVTE
jgi:hypothetical protein